MNEFLETAIAAARRGGEVLDSWRSRFTVSEKSPANLVTEADLASQSAIHSLIRNRFPDHAFLGEEDLNEAGNESEYCWVIDPLDGTSNYVHGFPYYAVSIALQKDNELIVGVVFDPNRNEMFTAVKSQGAHLNGEPIAPSLVDTLRESMTVASLPIGAKPDNPAIARFLLIMQHAQTVQRTGSAALNLVYVACGRIDAFWSTSLKPWDVAAGALIVAEASGRVSTIRGRNIHIEEPDILTTNGTPIHQELVELFTT
jgi:myo-inositol-1(or 4)-monophosphatase